MGARRASPKHAEHEHGFTLIELLVVMIIIGILAAIALPTLLNQKAKAREAAAKSDAANIAEEVSAGLVDGYIFGLLVPAAGGTMSWTGVDGTSGSAEVRLSPGNLVSAAGTAVTSSGVPGGDDFCITVTPSDPHSSPWSAGDKGIKKGTACP